MSKPMPPGTKVKLTGQFLRSTGQQAGGEGQSCWTVVDCPCTLCGSGRFVATNEPSSDDPTRPRHINKSNLYCVGTVDLRNA